MKGTIVVEQGRDGYFSCYMEEEIPYLGLLGYGESSQQAIDELKSVYEEEKASLEKEGKMVPEIEFTVKYDMASFFDRFDFLNKSKIAERAGINPSLLRKYTSGVAKAGRQQYEKLSKAVKSLATEMLSATF